MVERVALFGATGFVGSAVYEALEPHHQVAVVRTPRLRTSARTLEELAREAASSPVVEELAAVLVGIDVVVNAAGDPDASSLDEAGLFGANALFPGVLVRAAAKAGVHRLVHVSSAVVQNDKQVLDSSEEMRDFSPYSASKVMGEVILRDAVPAGIAVVRYRPPSVHAPGRRVTRMIARIADSPLASVARPGDQPTPQAQLPNVASAIAFVATSSQAPPTVVHHPSEGVTVDSLMRDLGGPGRRPLRLPRWLAKGLIGMTKTLGRMHRPTAANARRIELLWLGQGQSESWLEQAGWQPTVGLEGWKNLVPKDPS